MRHDGCKMCPRAERYLELYRQGYGKLFHAKGQVMPGADDRCEEQVRLANELVERTAKMRSTLAQYLAFGGGVRVQSAAGPRMLRLNYEGFGIDDLIQASAFATIRYLHQYRGDACFTTYLNSCLPGLISRFSSELASGAVKIPYNVRRGLERGLAESGQTPFESFTDSIGFAKTDGQDRNLFSREIDDALRSELDARDYRIVSLRVAGYDYREIGQIVGIPHPTVFRRYKEALSSLKNSRALRELF